MVLLIKLGVERDGVYSVISNEHPTTRISYSFRMLSSSWICTDGKKSVGSESAMVGQMLTKSDVIQAE